MTDTKPQAKQHSGKVRTKSGVELESASEQQASPDTRPRSSVRTRRARLRISRVDPWSVMKTSFLFSIAAGIMMWVAVYVLWTLIGASGMIEAINSVMTTLLSSDQNLAPTRVEDFVNTNKLMGFTTLFGVVNVVILTALGTVLAFLYNLSANILGGLELTLAED